MAEEANRQSAPIFDDVFFTVILSDSLSKRQADELCETLESNGAQKVDLASSKLSSVTHMVANNTDFPAYHDAVEAFIHVVKPSWIDQSVAKGKLSNPRQFSPDPQFFFSEVILTCANDIPDGDVEAIVGGVHAMGGQHSPKMTKLVTHLVTMGNETPEFKLIATKGLKCVPVLPHWFDACLRLGKKIRCEPYIVPTAGRPPLLSERPTDPTKEYSPARELCQSTPDPFTQTSTPPESPSTQRQHLSVFQHKRIMLHKDLDLSDRSRTSIENIITKGGGRIMDTLVNANMLVCKYRSSKEFVQASEDDKEVGNLNWLYYLIIRNRWSDPSGRLLHYPFPRGGVPGFSEFKISVSNYQGETRIWLEALVAALGGNFTKTMSQDTTHLVTAHQHSDKCDAAKEWNIDMVNHLWLEESYARCEIQPLTNNRYTTWPARSNLSHVVGQTPIDRRAIERLHLPHKLKSSQPEIDLTDEMDDDQGVHVEDNERTPDNEDHAEADEETSDGEMHEDQGQASNAEDQPLPGAIRTPAVSSAKKKRNVQTPAQRLGLNEATPGSRGAKDRALSKLHDMAPDIELYQKETKRTGGVIYGGRRATDPERVKKDDKDKPRPRKRSASEADSMITISDDEADDEMPAKKQKKGPSNSPIKVLLSGAGDPDDYRKKLKDLNVRFVEDSNAFDVIVLVKLARTRKVLCSIPRAPTIVDVAWLNAMAKKGVRLPYEDYLLKDPEQERAMEVKLDQVLANAKKNQAKGGMMKGWTVFATENISGGFSTLKDVVKANGGAPLLFKGRETRIPLPEGLPKVVNEDSDVEMDEEDKENSGSQKSPKRLLYMVSAPEDKALWEKFRNMTKEKGLEGRIVTSEWLWRIGMSQDASEWESKWKL